MNKYGVYQDGTTPMYRDVDGRLWAMSGHSHMGEIAMFKGTTLDDIKKVVEISLKLEGLPRNTSTHAAGVLIALFG